MTHDRKSMGLIWALLRPIGLLAVYFVAYLALVMPTAFYDEQYRYGGRSAVTFFRPLAVCDQFLFPSRWERETLPPSYQFEGVQYFPAGPEFPLSNEASIPKSYESER